MREHKTKTTQEKIRQENKKKMRQDKRAFTFLENKILRNGPLKMDMCSDVNNINDKCPS
jgi:hypothetical protein